jgi:hypothetical protein
MNRPDRPVQWYAFGNSGWGTNVEYEVIRHYALDYHPDLVVLLFLQNDPFDCSPYVVDPWRVWPVYYLDEHDDLVLVTPASDWKPPRWVEFASNAASFRYIMYQLGFYDRWRATRASVNLRGGVGGLPLRAPGVATQGVPIPGLERLSRDERKAKTWLLIEKLLEASRDECRRRGAGFALAFRGWMEEIDSPISGKPFQPKPRELDPYCLDEPRLSEMGREWLEPMARRLNIPYLDLTDALKDCVVQTKRSHTFVDDMHFNSAAHLAAGRALADWVEAIWTSPAAPK